MRIVFFGTPAFANPTLTEIVGQGHEVVAVYTQPPRAAGRGLAVRKSPVHEVADRFSIPVLTPKSLRPPEEASRFSAFAPEVAVVVAYGLILPSTFLAAPEQGCLNLHASLLPRWRGAAPIARAVMAGDAETGVMIMRMDEGLDTGPVAMSERVAIGPDMTAGELGDKLAALGADLMVRALSALSRGVLSFAPQAADGVTYAKKIDKAEARIDWERPGREIHNHIRGLSPDPGAWFEADLGKGPERVRALRSTLVAVGPSPLTPGWTRDFGSAPGTVVDEHLTIACGEGAVRLIQVQRAGRGPLDAADFLRGLHAPLTRVS
jgi:methionyl-tRNA formyltransferase